MQRRRRSLLAVPAGLILSFLVLGGTPATAEPLPKTILRIGGEQQRGRLWSSTDANGDGEGCSIGHGDGVPSPPKRAIEVEPGRFRGRIDLRRADEPSSVKLTARTGTDENGFVTGPREDVRWRLVPRPADATRRWVIRFRSRVDEHLYLRLGASWRDPSGCGGDHGSWLFHVRAAG